MKQDLTAPGRPKRALNLVLNALPLTILCLLPAAQRAAGQGTQPMVAIHDSELTRALELMPATGSTPNGAGTTGKQWWPTNWHYFVMPEAIKEALRSDGTAFTVVGDSNIAAGLLLPNGAPRYPIVISLASEAVRNDEIAALTNYVAAGGFLFVGSSSFTRNTNGTTRGDFAIANALGLHQVNASLTDWGGNTTLTKTTNHRIVNHIPAGFLNWRMPASSEEVPWGLAPHSSTPPLLAHSVWQVQSADATVLTYGDTYPSLAIKPYGKGYFIYYAPMQPLIGHGGWAPAMYPYVIFRKAIEWAFESANLPLPRLSPWPYPYDAALMVRHDLENFASEIAHLEGSAQFEYTNGAKGDYYFCTGTLRQDMGGYNTTAVIAGLRRAISNYGATIGPHNGGLKNPTDSALQELDYDFWHWGTDEALNVTPSGYASGKVYALTSLGNSFNDIESWLPGLMTPNLRVWCAPYFDATRENSYDIQAQLNVKITGEQKLTPFPHWTLSTQTPNKRYSILTEPVSEWYVNSEVAQSMEWHPSTATTHALVDYYYGLGALINLYSHTLSTGEGQSGSLAPDYITYSLNTNLHPRLWSANAIGIYQWWLQRSNAQITVNYSTNGNLCLATFSIAGAADTNATVELLIPTTTPYTGLQVITNGVLAGSDTFRTTGQSVNVRTGAAVTNVVVQYTLCALGSSTLVFSENFDGASAPKLPSGWTTSASGAETAWVTQTSIRDTVPNAPFVPDPASVGLSDLVSPAITVPSGQAQLSFRNNYDLESGPGPVGYDGGVLEIKIGAGAFTDIFAAGGTWVSGGYTHTIDSGYSSPIAGRQAWSGTSGSFVQTVVNLPTSAAGQSAQFRWRCGTDNGGTLSGWRIDTVALSNRVWTCGGGNLNTAPALPAQANRTIAELTALTVTNTASDADLPPIVLSYTLLVAPANAVISAGGIITWTPTEAQGPGSATFTTRVTDNGTPALSATNSFTVTVAEVNSAPVLPVQATRTVSVQATMIVTNTATDADIPGNNLSYTLLSSPAGTAIDANGVITWTPTIAQGPSTNTIMTVVTDNGAPSLNATNSFAVIVTAPNTAPVLPAQANQTIAELTLMSVTNTAGDADLPPNVLNYTLLAAPANASISASGIISWIPTEAQGPGSAIFTTRVTDNGTPPLSATNSFTVTVLEVNSAPVLPAQATRMIAELATLVVTNAATDSDLPANSLSYALQSPPAGVAVDINGVITWTPTLAQGPSTNTIIMVVTDNGVPPLSATNSFSVIVTAVNTAPVLPAQVNRTIAELTTMTVTNTASDSDLPPNVLSYILLAAPANAVISATGAISWTPTELQGPGSAIFTTRVSDNGTPALSATNTFTVTVTEVNSAPVLPAQASRTVAAQTTLVVTNAATDTDLPANSLSYALLNAPAGATIDTNGIITWTPTLAQGPGTNTITTVVADNGVPPLSATNSFTVTVTTNSTSGVLFSDDFTRSTNPGALAPWVVRSGIWTVTNGIMKAGTNTASTYGFAYLTNTWSNYSVQAQFQFPSGGYGGGLGGCLNPATGAHYAGWIYPEGSPGGARALKLVKFQTWSTWGYNGSSYTPMQQVSLTGVGTNWHTLKLAFTNNQITVFLDANQVMNVTDTEATPYSSGGVNLDMWTDAVRYSFSVDNLVVNSLASGSGSFLPARSAQVLPGNAPVLQSVTLSGGDAVITWTSEPGSTYRLQYKDDLAGDYWNDAEPDVTATDVTTTAKNSIGSAPQRYFRVFLVQ